MRERIQNLLNQAEQSAKFGQWVAAEQKWGEVLKIDPNNVMALFRLGIHSHQRQKFEIAITHLERAIQVSPKDPMIRLMLANVERDRGNKIGEIEVIDGILALDPYFYPALLLKGNWQEKHVSKKVASATYKNVLRIAPPESHWPPELRENLLHARRYSQSYSDEVHEKLKAALGSEWETNSKWREAISIMAGITQPYFSICNQLHVPRLPALTFYDISQFEWVKRIEAKTEEILIELDNLLKTKQQDFAPYIQYNPGEPVNQWAKLNHSDKWQTLPLLRYGERHEDNIKACPITAEAIQWADLCDIEGLCPNVVFSALSPHTEIPPHNGETNARLIAHLPLIVPDNCVFKVGFDERPWRKGEIFAFDDSLEHAAYNNSDELRVVILFDIWNPLISTEERGLIRHLTKTIRMA